MIPLIIKLRRSSRDDCYVPSNDERRATWALRYYSAGHHKNNEGSHTLDDSFPALETRDDRQGGNKPGRGLNINPPAPHTRQHAACKTCFYVDKL